MNNLPLITLLSSLISQILLLLFLLFPPTPFSLTHPIPNPHDVVPTLLHHFLSTAAAAAAILPKKRKLHDNGGTDKRSRLDFVVPRTPDSFYQLFKMKLSSFEWLCGLLEPLLECRDPFESPLGLPAEIRLGIGLLRLATGADYPEIAARFHVSESDSRFCVKHLCRVLCTNYRFWVGPPSRPELESVSTRIHTLAGIPNCCGTIGCARFNFNSNSNSNSNSNPTAVAAQIVADSTCRILHIAAGFRGRKRDSQILISSSLFSDVSRSRILNPPQYLIGHGEYPLLPWLILPFPNPVPGSPEENFNAGHRLIRSSWKKSVASLRNWGILTGRVEIEYKDAVACIGACSILHNMLIMREDYSAFWDGLDDEAEEGNVREFCDRSFGGESGEEVRKALAAMVNG